MTSHTRSAEHLVAIPHAPNPRVEAEWNWPRRPVSQVECSTERYRSPADAATSGFRTGVGSILDLLGSVPFVFWRRPPFEDDAEALSDDWRLVLTDFSVTYQRVHDKLVERYPEHDWPARQGTLFDADEPEWK